MKRVVLSGAALLAALVLPGCPVYPEERGCFSNQDCRAGEMCNVHGNCVIPPSSVGGAGGAGGGTGQCDEPSDCRGNQTCGSDRRCHIGDCTFHSCVRGFECKPVNGEHTCTRVGDAAGGAGGTAGQGDAAVDSGQAGGDAAGSGGTGTDASDDAPPTDAGSEDAPSSDGGGTDAPGDSAVDAPRDSASDAPRG